MSQKEIPQLPVTLVRLQCHVKHLHDVLAIICQCPYTYFVCDLEMYLVPFNMTMLLQCGLDSSECISSWSILDCIRNYVGSRCELRFSFCVTNPKNSLGWLTLAAQNTSLVLEHGTARTKSLSLDNFTFDPNLVKPHQHLTLLEFQSKTAISNLKLSPESDLLQPAKVAN